MEFYSLLSKHYDNIFQTNTKAISFIEKYIPNKESFLLLDLAAGTGAEAIEFAKKGNRVLATDNSPEMVEKIKEKGLSHSPSIETSILDMRKVSKLAPHSFNIIYCIGNSFVHLDNYKEMTDVLNDCYDRLKAGGKLIIQIVNYDRILGEDITELPLIKNEETGVQFERFYRRGHEKIVFKGKLTISKDGETNVYTSSTTLLPITKEQFKDIVAASHFTNMEIFGTFLGDKYTTSSPALVAVLLKE
ncbi:SAM-dependent methyltransferase [Evansella vedderi]|uniref:SAM-dependent methyltransferase n=1 Tax=Evansella vedderi TaxID=38282 RepID=A0ABT9ZV99_9BACI|nr:class I SAM-dependent methyltransferase [Evansella vedderi]MDQ0254870.1 SAM-dependent methyltransferase [Evansella vedderi]